MNRSLRPALLALTLGLGFVSALPAFAEPAWTCGAWDTHPNDGKCSEKRVCTRSVCDAGGKKLENCRFETRTECVPLPPKSGSALTRATVAPNLSQMSKVQRPH